MKVDLSAVNDIMLKAKMLGALYTKQYKIPEHTYDTISDSSYDTSYHYNYIHIIKNDSTLIVVIPDETEVIDKGKLNEFIEEINEGVNIDIKVIGGNGLYSADGLFMHIHAKSIDLSQFNSSNLANFEDFFCCTRLVGELILDNFDTSNAINMKNMFSDALIYRIDMRNIITKNVTNMQGMFNSFIGILENMNCMDTHNVISMNNMFELSKIVRLDVSSFSFKSCSSTAGMFTGVKCEKLVLNMGRISKDLSALSMFSNAIIGTLDIKVSFANCKVRTSLMFRSAKIENLNIKCTYDNTSFYKPFGCFHEPEIKNINAPDKLLELYNNRNIEV